ncbi:hypothetical protein P2W50_31145 [Pseudomonas protegens]|uniref:hypothetical protein n=1 Tax=Pseudomonas protegens TaxID=380021 RepID=UPI0023ED0079|nr:hypothetical protein [Pseudomonas protegens]MDF4211109.1 hypothetical protein [Pseudomonas protegens]
MKTLMVIAVLMLIAGAALSDVIMGGLAVSSLLFAGASVLAVRFHSQQPANA